MIQMLHEPYAWAEISYRRERLLSEADQQRGRRRAGAGQHVRWSWAHRHAA
jgi:hypothetical protein